MEFFNTATAWIVEHAGQIALWLVFFTKLANVTPTTWDNKALTIISGIIYKIFAVLGAKVPEIDQVKNGEIITVPEATAKEAVEDNVKASAQK